MSNKINTTQKTQLTPSEFSNKNFRFTLYKNNDFVICNRYFDVNGFYKPENLFESERLQKVLNSYDIKEMMDELIGMNNGYGKLGLIPEQLKKYSEEYMWNRYNPWEPSNDPNEPKNIWDDEETFTLEIAIQERVVVKGMFSGNFLPSSVRKHNVDIRKIIPNIIETITNTFTYNKPKSIDNKVVLN